MAFVLLAVLVATPAAAQQLPDLCYLDNASFTVWDAPSARCKACKGAGTGSLVPAASTGGCDGVVMQSTKGMAASFLTVPLID